MMEINFELYQPKPSYTPSPQAVYRGERDGWRLQVSFQLADGARHKPSAVVMPVDVSGEFAHMSLHNPERYLLLFSDDFRAWLVEFIREAENRETERRLALDAPVDPPAPESPQ